MKHFVFAMKYRNMKPDGVAFKTNLI